MKNLRFLTVLAIFSTFLAAQKAVGQTESQAVAQLDSLEKSWQWATGKIEFSALGFSISTPDGLRFLGREQSRFVLENLWGNAPDATTLGLFLAEKRSPLDSAVFAIEVRFDEIGRVDAADHEFFEADFLLASLQKDQKAINSAREKSGLPAIEIVGWAWPPRLESVKNQLFWAKKLRIDGDFGPDRISAEARVLGRRGCAAFNALGSMNEFEQLERAVESLAAATVFDEKADGPAAKKSAWSPAALVAGRAFSRPNFFDRFGKIGLAALGFLGLFWFLKSRRKASA